MYVIYKNKACVTSSCTIIQHDWGRGGQLQVSVWKKMNVTNSCENKVKCWPSKLPDISCQCGLKHFLTLTQQLTLTHTRTVRHCTSNKFVFVLFLFSFFLLLGTIEWSIVGKWVFGWSVLAASALNALISLKCSVSQLLSRKHSSIFSEIADLASAYRMFNTNTDTILYHSCKTIINLLIAVIK